MKLRSVLIPMSVTLSALSNTTDATDLLRFRDCPDCPEMIAIPSGSLIIGSTIEETDSLGLPQRLAATGRPRHQVRIRGFAAGVFEVSHAEYTVFVAATTYPEVGDCFSRDASGARAALPSATWRRPGIQQDDRHPVVCVAWQEVNAYVAWLSARGGKRYRLLSEAEWEYAARAGSGP